MPILDYRGMVFEWFDGKFELVNDAERYKFAKNAL